MQKKIMMILNKFYSFVRHHPIFNTFVSMLIFSLLISISAATYAVGATDTEVVSIIDMAKSVDFYAGAIIGASVGYGFGERTSGLAKSKRIAELKKELQPYKEALAANLIERINNTDHG